MSRTLGRMFRSCDKWKTIIRPQRWGQDRITDVLGTGEEMTSGRPQAPTTGGGHSVFEGEEEVVVQVLHLFPDLVFKHFPLERVVLFAVAGAISWPLMHSSKTSSVVGSSLFNLASGKVRPGCGLRRSVAKVGSTNFSKTSLVTSKSSNPDPPHPELGGRGELLLLGAGEPFAILRGI